MFSYLHPPLRNETDVREELIAPLVRALGYFRGSSCDVITEMSLRYPKVSLGRKKACDPVLRGRADYILDVDTRLRVVIEAKGPDEEIDTDAIDQAITYAKHPEVMGVYAVLTNGVILSIYSAIEANRCPIIAIPIGRINEEFLAISNLIAPDSLRRDFQLREPDYGKPLGKNLRSFAKIEGGLWCYTEVKSVLPLGELEGTQAYITEGTFQREEGGGISVFLKFKTGRLQMDESIRNMGFEALELFSDAEVISSEESNPTVFESVLEWAVPAGTEIFDTRQNRFVPSPAQSQIFAHTICRGFFANGMVKGSIDLYINMKILLGEFNTICKGTFEVRVS